MAIEEIAEKIREMEATEGWKIIDKFLNEQIAFCKQELENCKLEDVMLVREQMRTYRRVLHEVDRLKHPPID